MKYYRLLKEWEFKKRINQIYISRKEIEEMFKELKNEKIGGFIFAIKKER